MTYYKDLREYLLALEEGNKLVRLDREIVKETELTALVRLQFRGLPEEKRVGFLFENVKDVKWNKYDAQVAAGIYASSRDIYSMGMICQPNQIREKWARAQNNPITPKMVSTGPVQDVVYEGDDPLKDGKGLNLIIFTQSRK